MMGGNIVQKDVFNGNTGYMSGMGGNQKYEGETAKDKKIKSMIFEELAYLKKDVEIKILAIENVDGEDAYGIEIKFPSGTTFTRYYSVENSLMVRESQTVESPQGPITVNTDIKEYGEYEGIKLPIWIQQPMTPEIKMDLKIKSVEINGEVSDELFEE